MTGIGESELILNLIFVFLLVSVPLLATIIVLRLFRRVRSKDRRLNGIEEKLSDITED